MKKGNLRLIVHIFCLLLVPMVAAEQLDNQLDPTKMSEWAEEYKETMERTRRILQMSDLPGPQISRKGPTLMFPIGTSMTGLFTENGNEVGKVDWSKKLATDGVIVYVSPVEISRSLDHERLVQSGPMGGPYQNRLYYYKDSSEDSTRALSLAMAIIYMALAGCCMCCGLKQFYHLIKIPQMLFILSLIGSQPKPANLVNYLDGFKKNLFNIIPNPVKFLDDNSSFGCLLPIDFYVDGYTCNSYNTLKNYVLVFLVFLVIYILMQCNKYDNIHFWDRFKNTLSLSWFFLACAPDILIAAFLNLSAGSNNTPHGLGVLFAFFLIYVQFYLFLKYAKHYWNEDKEIFGFLSFFNFEPIEIIQIQPHSDVRKLFTAFVLENFKIWIKVIMIVFFNGHPKTSMVIIFVVYFLNMLYVMITNPYTHVLQSWIHLLSDACFCVIVILMFVVESGFTSYTMEQKEKGFGSAQVTLFWAIFFLNLLLLVVPALKNSREREIELHKMKILHEQALLAKASHHTEDSLPHPDEENKAKAEKADEAVKTTSKPNPTEREADPLFSEERNKEDPKIANQNDKFKTATDKFDMGSQPKPVTKKDGKPESLANIDPTPVMVVEKDKSSTPKRPQLEETKRRESSSDRIQLESLGNNVQHHIPDTVEVKKNNLMGKNEETSAMINQGKLPDIGGPHGRKIPLKKKTKLEVHDSDFENL